MQARLQLLEARVHGRAAVDAEDDHGDAEGDAVTVTVDGGEVRLAGRVRRRSTAEALPEHVARIAGVVGVTSEVAWREDDSRRERPPLFERAELPL